jgi:hypothetical protein
MVYLARPWRACRSEGTLLMGKQKKRTWIQVAPGKFALLKIYRVRRIRGRTLPQQPFNVYFRDTGTIAIDGLVRCASDAHKLHLRKRRSLETERRRRKERQTR